LFERSKEEYLLSQGFAKKVIPLKKIFGKLSNKELNSPNKSRLTVKIIWKAQQGVRT